MTATGPRDYDHLMKLLIIGDSGKLFSMPLPYIELILGVGKSSLLLRFADNTFSREIFEAWLCIADLSECLC